MILLYIPLELPLIVNAHHTMGMLNAFIEFKTSSRVFTTLIPMGGRVFGQMDRLYWFTFAVLGRCLLS
jgi:hypothetical protein